MKSRDFGGELAVATPKAQADAKRQEEIDRLNARLVDGVKEVAQSGRPDVWKEYLRFAARFTTYSARNQMLIYLQNPKASLVAGYRHWQSEGRQVRKGEKGLRIFAPMTRKAPHGPDGQIIDRDQLDQYSKDEVVWKPVMFGVKPISVFDVSQTDGKELPRPPGVTAVDGVDVQKLWDKLETHVRQAGFDLIRENLSHGLHGYMNPETKVISVDSKEAPAEAVTTLIHEMAHMELHTSLNADVDAGWYRQHRGVAEVQAESVAFMVAEYHGLDTADFSFTYIADWQKHADGEVEHQIAEINRAVNRVLDSTVDVSDDQQERAKTVALKAEAQKGSEAQDQLRTSSHGTLSTAGQGSVRRLMAQNRTADFQSQTNRSVSRSATQQDADPVHSTSARGRHSGREERT
jgi:hypothetical protein